MMTTDRPGALLRSGKAQGFQALATDGQPVHSAAWPLREMVRLKLGADAANCLALVQVDESGEHFSWHASFSGNVTSWAAATPAQRGSALAQLETLHAQLRDTARQMESTAGKPETQALARLLRQAAHFPGSEYVYLVDGKPVVTFWGFAVSGIETLDPLRYLRLLPIETPVPFSPNAPVAAAPVAAVAPVVVAAAPSGWRWLRWLLFLLLFLLLVFFLLRACAPQVRLPLGLSDIDLPGLPAAGAGRAPHEPVPAPVAEPASVVEAPVVESPPPSQENTEAVLEDAPAPPVDTPDQVPPGAALHIPPEAIKVNSLDFLNGRWRADAGIINSETNEPLIYEYVFKAGKGQAIITEQNGMKCRGPVSATLRDGALNIAQGYIKCSNNSQYNKAQVQCQPDDAGAANCTLRNAGVNQPPYSARITRISDN